MTRSPALQALMDDLRNEAEANRAPEETPDIGIVMGSDSDLPIMKGAYDALTELGFEEDTGSGTESRFSFETYVISAHRTPDLLDVYASTAEARGLKVILAAAGGKAADLPNVTAAIAYPIPVIGIPIQEKSVDSVIGMPTGVPIVAVDAGKTYNAALSAVQILASQHPDLHERLLDRQTEMEEDVAAVCRRVHEEGTPRYLGED